MPWTAIEAEVCAKERSEAWEKCQGRAGHPKILDEFARELSRVGVVGEQVCTSTAPLGLRTSNLPSMCWQSGDNEVNNTPTLMSSSPRTATYRTTNCSSFPTMSISKTISASVTPPCAIQICAKPLRGSPIAEKRSSSLMPAIPATLIRPPKEGSARRKAAPLIEVLKWQMVIR